MQSRKSKILTWLLGAVLCLPAAACEPDAPHPVGVEEETMLAARAGPNVVNVAAERLEFITSVDQLGSGWTTFRFKNRSSVPHLVAIEKLPVFMGEQITLEDYREDLVPPFQNLMDLIIGRPFTFPAAGLDFPAWAPTFIGGPGITSPGETSQVTVFLEPGLYVIECYMKRPDGTFHTLTMVEDLTVTEAANAAGAPPKPSVRLTLSSISGITVEGAIDRPGTHTVEVFFEDQAVYEHVLGHDVYVVRVDAGADLDEVAEWINWIQPTAAFPAGGLTSPAPATLLGGAQDSPAGSTSYFTVHLEKGDYAWIAEVPDPAGKNMLKTFSVP